jgi:hypothetical protein
MVFSGSNLSDTEEGGSTTTGSAILKDAVNMKKVTRRKAKSTIGVMSIEGELFAILIFGIFFFLRLFYKIISQMFETPEQ